MKIQKPALSPREKIRERNKKIKAIYKIGREMHGDAYTIDSVCAEMRQRGESVSRTTVFFAINGRSKKKEEKNKIKKLLKKLITKN